jgi:hypothetical protein
LVSQLCNEKTNSSRNDLSALSWVTFLLSSLHLEEYLLYQTVWSTWERYIVSIRKVQGSLITYYFRLTFYY